MKPIFLALLCAAFLSIGVPARAGGPPGAFAAFCWQTYNGWNRTTPDPFGKFTQAYIFWDKDRGLYREMFCNPGAELPVNKLGGELFTVGLETGVWGGIAMNALNYHVKYDNAGRELSPSAALIIINALR